MRTIKTISSIFILMVSGFISVAQSVDDGKKFLYYERYNSAKDVFTKLVNANPNNVDAVYWLGQTYIGNDDTTSAETLYQKTLMANSSAPLLLAGIGEVELLRNKTNDARSHFETAISLSKAKDFNVLNAIGRANVDAKAGDAPYAIEKLKLIPENKRTAEMWLTLGDAYRKMTDGGNAQQAYQSALTVDPNYAAASFMIGRIYQTQGLAQEPIYMRYYNDAMTKDPKYAPVYFWLYDYYYHRDVNKSRDYLDKYIAVSDADSKSCYYQAAILYASSMFKESIAKSDQCITSAGATPYPNLYGLKAYAFDKLGDSANAKTFFEMYFQKQNTEKLLSGDYATYGKILLKFPGNEATAAGYIDKAVQMDTLESDKIQFIMNVVNTYLGQKKYVEAANWYGKLITVKKNPSKTDIFNVGFNYYRGEAYKSADSAFKIYSQKYPEDLIGFYYSARSEAAIDSTGALGLAKNDWDKVIQLGEASTDTARVKSPLVQAYTYNVAYYYNVKKDIPGALDYVEKILKIDPTNANALANEKALKEAMDRKTKTKQTGDMTKTKTDTTKEKATPAKTKVKDR